MAKKQIIIEIDGDEITVTKAEFDVTDNKEFIKIVTAFSDYNNKKRKELKNVVKTV